MNFYDLSLHWHHGPFGDLSSHVLDLVQSGELRVKKVDAELVGGLKELNSMVGSEEVKSEGEEGAEDSAITAAGAVQGLVDGVLFDVGMSSRQLQRPERGFRVLVDAPLDMRMNAGSHPQSVQAEPGDPVTAASIINSLSEDALTRLLTVLGEEPGAAAIAKGIVEYRERRGPLERTTDLVDIVNAALGIDPTVKITSGPLPAVKTFMAIRRAVNREIEELAKGLRHAERLLRPGGKLVVITFNSLESRVINHFLESRGTFLSLTFSLYFSSHKHFSHGTVSHFNRPFYACVRALPGLAQRIPFT
jgi:16S rRNA (cytosine(1402)-N(4))-methyltransferase